MKKIIACIAIGAMALVSASAARAEVTELRVPLGAGLKLNVNYANIGGPAVMNDALLSGSADFISAGPPAFLILWDRTKGKGDVMGVAAMSTIPMYLNTKAEHVKSLETLKEDDKIAVTAVKVSIPSIIMQMYAKKQNKDVFAYDKYTVSMQHPDAVVAILSGNKQVTAHYASAPFHQREIKEGARTIQNTNDVMGGPQTFTMISTTKKFQSENPKVYAAFVAALKESFDMIKKDKKAAAEVLLESMGGKGWDIGELATMLDDKDTYFSTKPEGVMQYADFMHSIGSLKNKAASLDDLFFDAKSLGGGN